MATTLHMVATVSFPHWIYLFTFTVSALPDDMFFLFLNNYIDRPTYVIHPDPLSYPMPYGNIIFIHICSDVNVVREWPGLVSWKWLLGNNRNGALGIEEDYICSPPHLHMLQALVYMTLVYTMTDISFQNAQQTRCVYDEDRWHYLK